MGVGLSWGEFDWVVVTVLGGGLENAVSITAGVLKDIVHDRLELLDLCNRLTRDNPTYPVFLHDAQQGWDLLVQQQLPIDLMLTNPAFFKGCLENLPIYAQQKRQEIGNTTISGHRYTWNDDDTRRLLLRSMM